MNMIKVVGFVAGGMTLAALIGGGVIWWRRRKQKSEGDTPESPKRKRAWSRPGEADEEADAEDTRPRGHFEGTADLDPELAKVLDEEFPAGWPPDDKTIDALEQDDIIVFAVESEETGNYDRTRQELINAKVLSVEKTVVRGRILAPVEHAEHHGAHAGHGFRVGDLVEVPRSKILVAARRTDPKKTGYNSEGKAQQIFKSSDLTKERYRVRPATPYDLILPYRTAELQWHVDHEMVKMVHVGQKGRIEQIMFAEDTMRGKVSVRAIDHDPEVGAVFVARWDFAIDP